MRVFLSWAGERSRAVAAALHDWLPDVLHFVEPWMSDSDIHAGQRWASVVAAELEQTHFGIICVTDENRNAPWLLFEAGALSKSLAEATVVPLLLDVAFTDISGGPLGQFQAKKLDRQGCYELVASINAHSGNGIPDSRVSRVFERSWPDLERWLERIPAEPDGVGKRRHRPANEVLEELSLGMQRIESRLSVPETARSGDDDEVLEELSLGVQRIESRLSALETTLSAGAGDWPARGQTADLSRVPVSVIREAIGRATMNHSLRGVARQIGMSPSGVQHFLAGAQPYAPTLRRLNRWYAQYVAGGRTRGPDRLELLTFSGGDHGRDENGGEPDHSADTE
ncbi:MAG TPA: toll/interleukin-1 receptor domain-containing protein [Longimicrobium sp.]|nr:toll/interleukin-1 receptor domain-containing protein [Longimicrobium sp.]